MADEEGSDWDELNERCLHARQPLLDYGWRVDYRRMGICRAGDFIPVAELRQAVSVSRTPGTSERSPPQAALKAALAALEGHLSGELWIAMAGYRKRHSGATFEECWGELLSSGAIAAEWGIPERTWRQAWAWLEAGQPGPAPPSDVREGTEPR